MLSPQNTTRAVTNPARGPAAGWAAAVAGVASRPANTTATAISPRDEQAPDWQDRRYVMAFCHSDLDFLMQVLFAG
jgi:hypothetical protein